MEEGSIIYVDLAGHQPLPARDVLKVAGYGALVQSVTDPSAAIHAIEAIDAVKVVMVNSPEEAVFRAARAQHPQARTVLVTDMPMESYSAKLQGEEELLVDNVIANRPIAEWTTNEIRVTVQKILSEDIFGIEKYLATGAQVHATTIRSSAERDTYNTEVMKFAEACHLNSHVAKMIWGISEELLMNAIYDAPAAAGIQKYMAMPRSTRVDLEPEEFATLTYGCDGEVFAVATSDPFGLFTQEKLFEYVKKVLRRADSASLIDSKEGGAGLGLFKILYSSHALICNVEANRCTEIMALININEQLRDFSKLARSIHYFRC